MSEDKWLKDLFFNRMDRLLPFHHRHYFQSILMGQTYRGDGSVMSTAVLSDDGSTKAGLEPIGVWRGTIKQLKDEVGIEAPLYRLQFKFLCIPDCCYYRGNQHSTHRAQRACP